MLSSSVTLSWSYRCWHECGTTIMALSIYLSFYGIFAHLEVLRLACISIIIYENLWNNFTGSPKISKRQWFYSIFSNSYINRSFQSNSLCSDKWETCFSIQPYQGSSSQLNQHLLYIILISICYILFNHVPFLSLKIFSKPVLNEGMREEMGDVYSWPTPLELPTATLFPSTRM